MEFLKNLKDNFSLFLPVELALAARLIIHPAFTGRAVCYIISGLLLAKGVSRIIRAGRRGTGAGGGIFICLAGVFFALASDMIISFIPFVFGMILLSGGISSFQSRMYLKSAGYGKYGSVIFSAVLRIALAMTILINPFGTAMALTRFIGLRLLFDRCGSIVTAFKTAKVRMEAEKADRQVRSYNLGRESRGGEEIPVVDAEIVDDGNF